MKFNNFLFLFIIFLFCIQSEVASQNNQNFSNCYADFLIEYVNGCEGLRNDFTDPYQALGRENTQLIADSNHVSLGGGGLIKLGFRDNFLTSSGTDEADLLVYEVGSDVEATFISVRPYDDFTLNAILSLGIIDDNNDNFWPIAEVDGSFSTVDIDAIIPGYEAGELVFDAVEVTDKRNSLCDNAAPGADIDAVCALSNIGFEECDNNIDDDGDGFTDEADRDCFCDVDASIPLIKDGDYCDSITLTLETDEPFNNLIWYKDGRKISNDNQISLNPRPQVRSSGLYFVMSIADDSICERSEIVEIDMPFTTMTIIDSVCESEQYMFNGNSYFAGMREFTFQSEVDQCDSIVILDIRKKEFKFEIQTDYCEGDTIYDFQGDPITRSGIRLMDITAENGCRSNRFVTFTFFPNTSKNDSFLICDGSFVEINNQVYDRPGRFIQTGIDSNGCNTEHIINVDFDPTCNACASSFIEGQTLSLEKLSPEYLHMIISYKGEDMFNKMVSLEEAYRLAAKYEAIEDIIKDHPLESQQITNIYNPRAETFDNYQSNIKKSLSQLSYDLYKNFDSIQIETIENRYQELKAFISDCPVNAKCTYGK